MQRQEDRAKAKKTKIPSETAAKLPSVNKDISPKNMSKTERFRAKFAELDMTQAEAAELLGCTREHFCNVLNGKRQPSEPLMRLLEWEAAARVKNEPRLAERKTGLDKIESALADLSVPDRSEAIDQIVGFIRIFSTKHRRMS